MGCLELLDGSLGCRPVDAVQSLACEAKLDLDHLDPCILGQRLGNLQGWRFRLWLWLRLRLWLRLGGRDTPLANIGHEHLIDIVADAEVAVCNAAIVLVHVDAGQDLPGTPRFGLPEVCGSLHRTHRCDLRSPAVETDASQAQDRGHARKVLSQRGVVGCVRVTCKVDHRIHRTSSRDNSGLCDLRVCDTSGLAVQHHRVRGLIHGHWGDASGLQRVSFGLVHALPSRASDIPDHDPDARFLQRGYRFRRGGRAVDDLHAFTLLNVQKSDDRPEFVKYA